MCPPISNFHETSKLTVETLTRNCTKIMEHRDTDIGAGREMENPFLNIFLGAEAIARIDHVRDAYDSCWSQNARELILLKDVYTRQELEDAIVASCNASREVPDRTKIRLAWFWDIMDENFDACFEAVKMDYALPLGVEGKRVVFVFCSQNNSENQNKTANRLRDRLIPWAKDNKVPLIMLSDVGNKGLLHPNEISENYRLAASLMLIMNTHYDNHETNLGKTLSFEIESTSNTEWNERLWSGAYYCCSKNFEDIIGISLWRIIQCYQDMCEAPREGGGDTNVQRLLCGDGKNYFDLLDQIFEEIILPVIAVKPELWYDVPYTSAMQGFEKYLPTLNRPDRSFFSRLFTNTPARVTPHEVLTSLGDFWKCCVMTYYIEPVLQWVHSDEGMKSLQDYVYSHIAAKMNYNEMQSYLDRESWSVRALFEEENARLPDPKALDTSDISRVFHDLALHESKRAVYKTVLSVVADTMESLSKNAGGFKPLLNRVKDSLQKERMEHTVVTAYGDYVKRLLDQAPNLLRSTIRPCETEEMLLQQLEQVFKAIVDRDPDRRFRCSLHDDLEFRMGYGTVAGAVDAIRNCFGYKLKQAGRLIITNPPSGTLYCIMNTAMKSNLSSDIQTESIGNPFIVTRSDRIERLFLYPVKASTIIFSNRN